MLLLNVSKSFAINSMLKMDQDSDIEDEVVPEWVSKIQNTVFIQIEAGLK